MLTLEQLADPQHSAVIVVDVQNDYCHPDGAEAALGAQVRLAADMAPRLERFLEQARRAKLRIIFVRTHHSSWTNSNAWLMRGGGRHNRADVRVCLPDTWGADFYAGIRPRQSSDWDPARHDYVVTKHRYSGFVDTDLDLVLRAQKIDTLIMTGTASNGCVEATARDGFMKDYRIVYVSDCSVAATVEQHAECLRRVRSWARVATAEELLQMWEAAGVFANRGKAE